LVAEILFVWYDKRNTKNGVLGYMINEIVFLCWNVCVMLLYGLDKLLAKMQKRRISEKTLLIAAFLFGGAGAILGMVVFNHKTSKIKFRFWVPVFLIINVAIIFLLKRGKF